MRARRAPRAWAAAVLVWLLAAPAAADYKDTYRKALEAVDRKRWAEVVQLMREAIAQNPKEGERVKVYGLRFEPYVPHYHLGIALRQTGDCAGALAELQLSESQGAIRSTPLYSQLADTRQFCLGKVAQAAPATQATPPPTVAAATPPPTTVAAAIPVQPAVTRPTGVGVPTPVPLGVAPRPGAVPADLVRAASAYFAGRYEETVSLVDRMPALEGRMGAQARLFAAAARLALFRMGGEKDAALRQRALDDVAACRRKDPNLRPDPEAFPPTVADLFRR